VAGDLRHIKELRQRHSLTVSRRNRPWDAAGKDGVIKHVMSGVNPQGCQAYSFKTPLEEDLNHDYLWRTLRRPRSLSLVDRLDQLQLHVLGFHLTERGEHDQLQDLTDHAEEHQQIQV